MYNYMQMIDVWLYANFGLVLIQYELKYNSIREMY